MSREGDRPRSKIVNIMGKGMGNGRTTHVFERDQLASLKGHSPLLDETPGQPEFKKLRQHPKITLLMKQPGHRMVLRTTKEDDEIVQKEVLVYNAKNDLCGKLVWTPSEGEQFSLIS